MAEDSHFCLLSRNIWLGHTIDHYLWDFVPEYQSKGCTGYDSLLFIHFDCRGCRVQFILYSICIYTIYSTPKRAYK